jgi:hypothetical protein
VKVLVYVEGRSDIVALNELLRPLVSQKQEEGVFIDFHDVPNAINMAHNKYALITKIPSKAVKLLRNDPDLLVAVVPDLFPQNKAFAHKSADELIAGTKQIFADAVREQFKTTDASLTDRFHVFCFKHDLEALVLAAEAGLSSRLGVTRLPVTWTIPVEDQNHNQPPKYVIQELFKKHGQYYQQAIDAPLILSMHTYQEIADRCPQCFKPFVTFLESLTHK